MNNHKKDTFLSRSDETKLMNIVHFLDNESRCRSALSYILRALDYEPHNQTAMELAYIIVHGCDHHERCQEPVTYEQMKDQRLDAFFNECSVNECRTQWVTNPLKKYFKPRTITTSSIGLGGYCYSCQKAFCREHVKEVLPTVALSIGVHCPRCGRELNIDDAFGRNSNQAPRLNKKLTYAVLVREGRIPPDKEYCVKVFRNASVDIFEDVPVVTAMALYPWEYNAERVLQSVLNWLKDNKLPYSKIYQTITWSGLDAATNTRFHLIKIWGHEPRVTHDSIFTEIEFNFTPTDFNVNFPYKTAVITIQPQFVSSIQREGSDENLRPTDEEIEEEFTSLFQTLIFENCERFLSYPEQTKAKELDLMASNAVNKASDLLMKKYHISEMEMARIIERAVNSMASNVPTFPTVPTVPTVPTELQITAETVSEAKKKLLEEIPPGCFLISMEEIEPRKLNRKTSDYTIEKAFNQARKNIPSDTANLKETVVREPQKTSLEIIAFDSEQAKILAVEAGVEAVDIIKTDLVKKGRVGLFGIGKKPNTYSVELCYKAIVNIEYNTRAKIIGEITDDKGIANEKYLDYSEKGNFALVKILLQQGIDIDVCNSNGANALIVSAFYGKPKVSLLLIDNGININSKDHGGFNALMVACECAEADIGLVKKLIDNGTNVNATSNRGSTALMAAAKIGHLDIVKLLVSKGADINAKNTDHNVTPLIWAANGGYLSIVKFLLEKGADPNIRTINNYTAKTIAKENGHYSIVELLDRY